MLQWNIRGYLLWCSVPVRVQPTITPPHTHTTTSGGSPYNESKSNCTRQFGARCAPHPYAKEQRHKWQGERAYYFQHASTLGSLETTCKWHSSTSSQKFNQIYQMDHPNYKKMTIHASLHNLSILQLLQLWTTEIKPSPSDLKNAYSHIK
jgi:hypothetical protein